MPRVKKRVWLSLVGLVLVAVVIYSGTAWFLLKPVVHKELINKYAARYRFDPLWIMSIIRTESRFTASAESHRGAIGLMQLLPKTAQEIAPEVGLTSFTADDLKDPETNIHLGLHYLDRLRRMYPDDELAILAAYNAGPGIVREWRQGKPALLLEDIAYPETRRFVKQIEETYHLLKFLQRWKSYLGIRHGR